MMLKAPLWALAAKTFNCLPLPYSVECKAHKAFAFYKIMEQAASNCPKGAEPLVIIKGDRKKPLAVMDAEHFFKLTTKGDT